MKRHSRDIETTRADHHEDTNDNINPLTTPMEEDDAVNLNSQPNKTQGLNELRDEPVPSQNTTSGYKADEASKTLQNAGDTEHNIKSASLNFGISISKSAIRQLNEVDAQSYELKDTKTMQDLESMLVEKMLCQSNQTKANVTHSSAIMENAFSPKDSISITNTIPMMMGMPKVTNELSTRNKKSQTFFAIRKQRLKQRTLNHTQFRDESELRRCIGKG